MNWGQVWTSTNFERLMVGDLTRGEPGGLLLTLMIGVLAIFGATILGAIFGVMRASRYRIAWVPAMLYIQTLRNVPPRMTSAR